ncbi:NAD(P)/FAD-dependent oxidoreductase [Amycolatopsis sp.]|uniref:flavin-containing monooxygenase n=1 Tax=Amycolatopsis sp. TaxID=37632 RepID=UPI002CA85B48|nr:NAD(P)/FAD-dependent oxidoreductase [Amycolatopsis sp.]HVV08147.1 NAD(P)/FAD-dependent oxidoreductase [Amycolatopsis sp.]
MAEDYALRGEGLRRALADAELAPLLPALAHLTGNLSILEPSLRPGDVSQVIGQAPQGGLGPEEQDRARRLAEVVITRWADAGCPPPARPTPEQLLEIMRFVAGPVGAEQLPLLYHQLGLREEFEPTVPVEVPDGFLAVIVGAGMSGLIAAHHLRQAGVPFIVFERNDDVGGVWLENTYPGVRLDTSNFCYSYSYAQGEGWDDYYSPGLAVHHYLRDVAREHGLYDDIRFGTTVDSLTFDETDSSWLVETTGRDGESTTLRANVVISAVGQLNNPRYPDLAGLASFAGQSWHTARWNHDVPLAGKRVAVIGTGASAFQVIGQIAPEVERLTIFQRTPPWVMPTPTYTRKLKPGLRWLFRALPLYQQWYRFNQFWANVEGRRRFALVDPDWQRPGSVSPHNGELRDALLERLAETYAGRPDLLAKMTPDYPPYAKRMLRDDGAWASALKQDNVEVVTEKVTEAYPGGLRTADGTEYPADVIIFGTGFTASDFLDGIRVRGRGGADLHEQWGQDARALGGITVPNFPNLFLLYGPNTNLVVNGSIVFFSEAEVEFVLSCLRHLFEQGLRALEPTEEALAEFYARVDAASERMAFGVAGVSSWYKSSSGRVTQNWPLSTLEFWEQTRAPDPSRFRMW